MTTLITIGNLTKDAQVKSSKNGKEYVLLNIVENIYKRDENGKILKDEKGHYVTLQTMFYSVFVYDNAGALTASNLKQGHAVKVIGRAKIRVEKDSNNYNQNIIDSITAFSIDTDPFNQLSESEGCESEMTE